MIIVYGGKHCSACDTVKDSLRAAGIPFEYVDVLSTTKLSERHTKNFFGRNFKNIPQIFRDDEHIGSASVISHLIMVEQGEKNGTKEL